MITADGRFRKIPRIIYNDDSCSVRMVPPPHTVEKVYTAVDHLKDTQVDILCFCLVTMFPYSYLSKTIDGFYGRQGSDFGQKTNYFSLKKDLIYGLRQKEIDYLPLLIKRTQEHGIRFFASFRMNDIHHRSTPSEGLSPAFWREHQSYRLWSLTDAYNYYNTALDYSHPEVRERYFSMVEEIAQRYDVDGIELDFCREPYYFQPGEGWGKRHIMADFVRSIRRMLNETGRRKGKKISLLIRTVFDPERLKETGMDIADWLEKGYLDILVMAGHSNPTANDTNVLLEPWLGRCRKHGVLFYPSVEMTMKPNGENKRALIGNPRLPAHNVGYTFSSPTERLKVLRAIAQNHFGQGAAGIYLFNHPCALYEGDCVRFTDPARFQHFISYLKQLGSQNTLTGTEKRYLFLPGLPICVESRRPPEFHQTVRFNIFDPAVKNKNAKAVLKFRQVAEKNPHAHGKYRQNSILPKGWVEYLLNGIRIEEKYIERRVQPKGRIPSAYLVRKHELVVITIPANRLTFGENKLAFHIPRFPEARDPYVYIYELEAGLNS